MLHIARWPSHQSTAFTRTAIWMLVFDETSISRGHGSVLATTYPRGAVTLARTRVTPARTSHRKDPSRAVIPSSRQSLAGSTTVTCSEATRAPWSSKATNTMLAPTSGVEPVETTIRQADSVSSAATGTHHRHGANGPLARFGIGHCAPFRPRTQWTRGDAPSVAGTVTSGAQRVRVRSRSSIVDASAGD